MRKPGDRFAPFFLRTVHHSTPLSLFAQSPDSAVRTRQKRRVFLLLVSESERASVHERIPVLPEHSRRPDLHRRLGPKTLAPSFVPVDSVSALDGSRIRRKRNLPDIPRRNGSKPAGRCPSVVCRMGRLALASRRVGTVVCQIIDSGRGARTVVLDCVPIVGTDIDPVWPLPFHLSASADRPSAFQRPVLSGRLLGV